MKLKWIKLRGGWNGFRDGKRIATIAAHDDGSWTVWVRSARMSLGKRRYDMTLKTAKALAGRMLKKTETEQ